jgi:hypothetical protein
MAWPVAAPAIVLVEAIFAVCELIVELMVGLYTERMLAIEASKVCWLTRCTAMSRLLSSARLTASSSVNDTRGPVDSGAAGNGVGGTCPATVCAGENSVDGSFSLV